jgi:ATP-binding cassette, subfamily C (CFTR/MRP), member 1
VVVAYILFLSFALIGGHFTVQKVYTAMAILNITRLPIALFPMSRTAAAEAANSISRIKEYLLLPELKPLEIQPGEESQEKAVLVKIEDASFDWTEPNETDQAPSIETRSRKGSNASVQTIPQIPATSVDSYVDQYDMISEGEEGFIELSSRVEAANPTQVTLEVIRSQNDPQHRSHSLRSVNLEINPGDLVAVIGPVGSGKTSLLSAILGQMNRVRGTQTLNCKVAYAGQEHWIQNLTLRDNVLFDEPFDEDRYAECLDASQLSTDLVNLPNADFTEIGERGINLSGGQKARVNLARALYASNVDLYLLDDILASVDVHVAKAIFDSAILELLKDSARVLVLSSNYHLLPHFNKIVVIQPDGLVSVCSSYLNLKQRYPQYVTPDADRKYEELLSTVAAMTEGQLPSSASPPSPTSSSLSESPSKDRRELLGSPRLPFNHSVWHMDPQKSSRLTSQSNRSSIFRSMKLEILEKQHQSSTLTTIEDREKGEVSLQAYISYFSIGLKSKTPHTSPSSLSQGQAGGDGADSDDVNGVLVLIFILLLFAIGQTFRVWTDLWVGIWAKGVEDDSHNRQFYVLIYTGLLLGSVIFVTGRAFYFMMRCMATSEAMHFSLVQKVFAAPINTYFDVTPLGRILNRFSKDLDVIDCLLPDFFLNMLQNMCHVLSVLGLCVASTPYFAIIFAPLAIIFYFIQEFYRKTSRELKRLDAVSRSPLYTLFGETLVGLPTVRAYGREEIFMEKHHETSDRNGKNFFIFWCCSRWLAMRLDLISTVVVTAVGLIAVIMVNRGVGVSDNILGLALVYSLQLAGLLQWVPLLLLFPSS